MKQPPAIVERLLAHARICREIAAATANAQTALELERLAEDCIEAARETDRRYQKFHDAAAGGRKAS